MTTEAAITMTPEQVADRWGCVPPTVRAMLRDGTLRGFKTGRGAKAQWRVLRSEVERFEREGAANA